MEAGATDVLRLCSRGRRVGGVRQVVESAADLEPKDQLIMAGSRVGLLENCAP